MSNSVTKQATDRAMEKFKQEICLNKKLQKKFKEDSEGGDPIRMYDLSVGFFLCCGLTWDQANNLAVKVRYDRQYWGGRG